MRALLDTHALLWMVADDPRLSTPARHAITTARELYWSAASLWEIGIKIRLDRPDFRLAPDWARAIPAEMERNAIRRLEIAPAHCLAVSQLPWHHRDPFDRLLVAQAQTEDLVLLSRDPHFTDYPITRLW